MINDRGLCPANNHFKFHSQGNVLGVIMTFLVELWLIKHLSILYLLWVTAFNAVSKEKLFSIHLFLLNILPFEGGPLSA